MMRIRMSSGEFFAYSVWTSKYLFSIENAGVEQFKFRIVLPAPRVFVHKLIVRKFRLRIFVQALAIRMRRRGIEVVIALLDIFAVISFGPGQAEQTLFQNRIALIPQRHDKAEPAFAIGEAQQAIFAPAIRPAARMIMREITPAIPVGGIILPNRSPLPLGKIGSPAFPILIAPSSSFRRMVSASNDASLGMGAKYDQDPWCLLLREI